MQHIVVAGSGRSGTTWIGDVLSSCLRSCAVFEPLRADLVPEVPNSDQPGEHPATYLRPDDEHPEWQTFFRRLFAGGISNCWTRQKWKRDESRPRRLLPHPLQDRFDFLEHRLHRLRSRNCVIKEIRANLLLGWLSRHFPVRVVYLLRHPCAVVGSRLRLQWSDVLSEVIAQPPLISDFLSPYIPLIERAKTPLQRMAVHWCVENLVPLCQLRENPQWIAVSYEDFVAGGDDSFRGLFEALNLTPSPATNEKMKSLVSMPSSDAGTIRPWHHPLTETEGSEVLDLCAQFGIGMYGRDAMPLIKCASLHTSPPRPDRLNTPSVMSR